MIGGPSSQGPAQVTPKVDLSADRIVVRTWDGVTMGAANLGTIVINQGADFLLRVTWADQDGTARDLTGYTAVFTVRQQYGDVTPLLTITPTITPGSDNEDSAILIAADAATTATYTGWVRALYDLVLLQGGTINRLCQGVVELARSVR